MKSIVLGLNLCLVFFASGLSIAQDSGPSSYDDPRMLQMQAMQARILGAMGGAMPAQGIAAGQPAPVAALSEADLNNKIMMLPNRPERLLIKDRKDGFTVNGMGYVDPEGRIRNYAIDVMSGLVTYLAEVEQNTYRIKVTRAGTDAEPIVIGSAMRNGMGWQVDSATGKRITGQTLTVLPGAGYLVTRDTAAILYRAGQSTTNIAIPNGFVAARFQRGDVMGTNHLLLERDVGDSSQEKNLFDSFKALGSTLGLNSKEDYALLNIKTGEMIALNVSESGKNVSNYSNCRRKNNFVNECANVDFRESLYDKLGRNLSHYYWRINWFNTPTAPILVAQENGLKEITIRDLKSGRKVTAFSRIMGIAGHDSVQDDTGKIHITAQMGFSTEKIEDAVAFLAAAQEPLANVEGAKQ